MLISSSKRFAFFITCVHSLFYEVELPLSKKSLRFLHKLLFFSYCLIFKVLSVALLRQLFNYITHISICQQLFYSFYQVFSNFFVCFATPLQDSSFIIPHFHSLSTTFLFFFRFLSVLVRPLPWAFLYYIPIIPLCQLLFSIYDTVYKKRDYTPSLYAHYDVSTYYFLLFSLWTQQLLSSR